MFAGVKRLASVKFLVKGSFWETTLLKFPAWNFFQKMFKSEFLEIFVESIFFCTINFSKSIFQFNYLHQQSVFACPCQWPYFNPVRFLKKWKGEEKLFLVYSEARVKYENSEFIYKFIREREIDGNKAAKNICFEKKQTFSFFVCLTFPPQVK